MSRFFYASVAVTSVLVGGSVHGAALAATTSGPLLIAADRSDRAAFFEALERWNITPKQWVGDDGDNMRRRLDIKNRRGEFEAAASRGDVVAMTLVGNAYAAGLWSTEPNYEEAYKFLLAAAQAGDGRAIYGLGFLYDQGLGVTADYKSRDDLWEASRKLGFGLPDLTRGQKGIPKQKYEKAFSLFIDSADMGSIAALRWLAYMADEGLWVTKDAAIASAFYKDAAEAGDHIASGYYGARLIVGKGLPIDLAKGDEMLKFAASFHIPQASADLGLVLHYGTSGHPTDPIAARRWYLQAVTDGDVRSYNGLGQLALAEGKANEAKRYFSLGKAGGDEVSAANLVKLEEAQRLAALPPEKPIIQRVSQPIRTTTVAASSGASANGGPTSDHIARVSAQSNVRYFGGQVTSTPGQVAYPSPFGGIAYYVNRYVENPSCSKIRASTYRCSYLITYRSQAASDSLFGSFAVIGEKMTDGSYNRTNTFVNKAGVWISPELDEKNRISLASSTNNARSITSSEPSQAEIYNARMKAESDLNMELQMRGLTP